MIQKKKNTNLLLPLLLFFFFFSALSQTTYSSQIQTYIVHVQRPRHTGFLRKADHENWHRSFLPNTTLHTGELRLVYSYHDVISGFAAQLTSDEVRAMESIDGFLHAQPDDRLSLATTHTPAFLGLSQWNSGLWVDSSFGEGIVIGVIDGGIDPSHPSFRDDDRSMPPPPTKWNGRCDFHNTSLCNNKLIGAIAFRGGCRPWPSDDENDGHGTHVAGIAAGGFVYSANVLGQAKGRASGMAPKAHIAIYKVCYEDGCAASDILAAIDQAIGDGVDVLSISIAHRHVVPMYNDTIAIGSLAAVKKGIFACLPAGNFGPFKSIIFNDAPWILTVGASSADRRVAAIVRLGNGMELEGESAYQPSNYSSTLLPIVFPGYNGQRGRKGCENGKFEPVDVKGKIVLCKAGGVQNTEKGRFVKNAGGVAMIVLNPFYLGSTTFSEAHVLPVAHVSHSDALKILSYLKSNSTQTAALVFRGTQFGARPSPAVAAFSSRGPSLTNGGILKPDIIGPGANILSSWPTNILGSATPTFNFLSGTSMAAPHLAGIAALLKSTHPHWSPAAIKSAIITTADRLDLDGNPIVDEFGRVANLISMGSGHVNPSAANDPGLVYDLLPHQYIRYLCGLRFTEKQIMIIARHQIQCFDVPKTSVEELNYPSISVSLGSKQKKIISRLVTNVGEANEVYSVHIEEPKGVKVKVSPYKLHFTKLDQKKRFYVEFSFYGKPKSKGEVLEGQLMWISGKDLVRSPISVILA